MKKNKIGPKGDSWEDFKSSLLSSEERDELELKIKLVSEILKARQELGLTQKQLEAESGVKQPIIARLEKGTTDPQLTTVLKILRALGKTLAIIPIDEKAA